MVPTDLDRPANADAGSRGHMELQRHLRLSSLHFDRLNWQWSTLVARWCTATACELQVRPCDELQCFTFFHAACATMSAAHLRNGLALQLWEAQQLKTSPAASVSNGTPG
jgi:hypothetical protein